MIHRLLLMLTILAVATLPASAPAQPSGPPAKPPAWWAGHVVFMSRDGGAWTTPNPDAGKDPAQPDAFGMEWRAVHDGSVLAGRLFGLKAGREVAEYWTYREFYHPGERRVLLQQWGGGGVFGAGETTAPAADQGEVDQTFWLTDGRSWREGHRTREGGDEYVTEVFDIAADGRWTSKSRNVWRRVTPAAGS